MGRLFNLFVQIFAVKGYLDTQCGYKCFTSQSAENYLESFTKIWVGDLMWNFDVSKQFHLHVEEMPVFGTIN